MTKREFRDGGYLQEVNRQFFHPLGLAMALGFEDDMSDLDEEVDGSLYIYEDKDDPEGFYFAHPTEEAKADFVKKAELILEAFRKRADVRNNLFGGWGIIQPVNFDTKENKE